MFLVALGIVYGDIGTSPMYVMKSIVEGNGGITNVDQDFIVGSLSLVIWTITLLTTVKHVLIALRADNHGGCGGIRCDFLCSRGCVFYIKPRKICSGRLCRDYHFPYGSFYHDRLVSGNRNRAGTEYLSEYAGAFGFH